MNCTIPPAVALDAIHTGRAVPYTRPGSCSAIAKVPVSGPVRIHAEGIEGDEQGDRRVHGGPEKAIHHYPFDHYAFWRGAHRHPLLDGSGAFGENFSSTGWTEDTIHLADVIRVGTATLQVSQGRQPCWKLNLRFGVPDMSARVQNTLRAGWYCRTRLGGVVQAVGQNLRHRALSVSLCGREAPNFKRPASQRFAPRVPPGSARRQARCRSACGCRHYQPASMRHRGCRR